MNRTLRRPMFRMGGTAEGITSGLDAPDINKRQNLNVGGGADARRFISRAKNMPSLSENKTLLRFSKQKTRTREIHIWLV